jgi:hypothetical protein
LAKHGAQLQSYEDYKRSEPSPNIGTLELIPIISEDRREKDTSLYMSSIKMFESKTEAEFNFSSERLTSVGVYFDPIAHSKAESVVATIVRKLQSSYESDYHITWPPLGCSSCPVM